MTENESVSDDEQAYPWPGFVDMKALRALLTGLHVRGVGVVVIVDLTRRTVDADGVIHRLDVAELLTIERLAETRGTVVSRDELAEAVAGSNRVGARRVDAIVGQIRSKLGQHSDAIEAHYGRGYSLREGEDIEVRNFDP